MSAQIQNAWTAFATDGAPGWPPYDATQIFDSRSNVTTYPEENSRRLWQNRTFAALPLLSRYPDPAVPQSC